MVMDTDSIYFALWTFLRKSSTKDPDLEARFEEVKGKLSDDNLYEEELTEQARYVVRPDLVHKVSKHLIEIVVLSKR